jgi:hypothetical protein
VEEGRAVPEAKLRESTYEAVLRLWRPIRGELDPCCRREVEKGKLSATKEKGSKKKRKGNEPIVKNYLRNHLSYGDCSTQVCTIY